VDQCAVREDNLKGGRPAYPTETMVRILVLKRLNNHSDERMAFLLLDQLSYQRFRGLTHSLKVPDRTTIWSFENRMGEAGAMVLFEGVSRQLLKKGFIARGDQMIEATLVPAPKQKMGQKKKEIIDQKATLYDWEPAQRRQKDTDATWTRKHGKSYFG
jgi:IS5 family transposase